MIDISLPWGSLVIALSFMLRLWWKVNTQFRMLCVGSLWKVTPAGPCMLFAGKTSTLCDCDLKIYAESETLDVQGCLLSKQVLHEKHQHIAQFQQSKQSVKCHNMNIYELKDIKGSLWVPNKWRSASRAQIRRGFWLKIILRLQSVSNPLCENFFA